MENFINISQPDVICLSETHVTEDIFDHEIEINNYNCLRTDSNNRRTGGVCTYIKKQLKYKLLLSIDNITDKTWINVIEVENEISKHIFGNVYRSPNSNIKAFCDKFIDYASRIGDAGKLVLVGDFNIDVSKNTCYSKRLIDEMAFLGYTQMIQTATRSTFNSDTIIDLVFTNMNIKTNVLNSPKISDHNIIKIVINNRKEAYNNQVKLCRNFKAFNDIEYKEKLFEKFNLYNIKLDACNEMESNELNSIMIETMRNTLDELAPWSRKTINNKHKNKPWIKKSVVELIKRRDAAFIEAKKTNKVENKCKYKELRNEVVKNIRESKKKYYENVIDINKKNTKEMWKKLKELTGDKKQKSSNFNEVNYKGDIIRDNLTIANKLNDYFIESINEIVNNIGCDDEVDNYFNISDTNNNNRWEKFDEISFIDMNKIINNMDEHKGDRNDLNTHILKLTWQTRPDVILAVINNSLKLGIVPEDWKISIITPIQKVKNSINVEDLRPINTLPSYEKILEEAVKIQLENFIEKNNILSQDQSGFRKSHSCETTLQNSIIDWRNKLDKGLFVGIVYLDLARAFETINRKRLTEKMKSLGITGVVLKWFESYLFGRKQRVKFKNVFSNDKETIHGVPQGSKLGPLLFILFINDIMEIFEKRDVNCKLFADDTILYTYCDNLKGIETELNDALLDLQSWLKYNQLKLNVKKTVYSILHNKQIKNVRDRCEIKINDQKIEYASKTKYLGVIVDDQLTFKENAMYVARKVTKKINLLYRLKNTVSSYTKNIIYKSIIAPNFEYCNTIVLNYSQSSVTMLQKLQNRAMRIILGVNRYTEISKMLDTLGYMSINQRLVYNCCILIHKMRSNLTPTYLSDRIQNNSKEHGYNTRNKTLIKIRHTNTHTGERSITYRGYTWYNDLPNDIREEDRMPIFKRRLKEYIKLYIDI